MQAVILAAGKSRPSQGFPLNYKPKCLLHWKGKVILERNVKLLRKHGVKTIIVVVGYQASKIKAFARKRKLGLKFVLSPKLWTAGLATFHSFTLGAKAVTSTNFLLILGDVIVSEKLLVNLLSCKRNFCVNQGGQIMAVKLKKKGLNLKVVRKELLTYKPPAVRRHMLSMGFDRYLRKRGAQVVKGDFWEIDSFWQSGEGIIARNAIKRFDV